jgi:hypothetical protein
MASNCLQVTAGDEAYIFDLNQEEPRLVKAKKRMDHIGNP